MTKVEINQSFDAVSSRHALWRYACAEKKLLERTRSQLEAEFNSLDSSIVKKHLLWLNMSMKSAKSSSTSRYLRLDGSH